MEAETSVNAIIAMQTTTGSKNWNHRALTRTVIFLGRNISSKIYYNQYGTNRQVTAKQVLPNTDMDLL